MGDYLEDGRGIYRGEPLRCDERTRCKKVHEKVWEDGRLVKDEIGKVRKGKKYDRRY